LAVGQAAALPPGLSAMDGGVDIAIRLVVANIAIRAQ